MTAKIDPERGASYQTAAYGAVPQVEHSEDNAVVELGENSISPATLKKVGLSVAALLLVASVASSFSSTKNGSGVSLSEEELIQEPLMGKPKKELKDWQTPLYFTEQFVDHFAEDTGVWPNRYYVGEESWKGPGYPMFVIIGGEGPIDEALYPYVVDILAPKFGAYVLQTEHRFYGTSIPTKAGPSALPTPEEFRRLFRPDQAIEDDVRLIRHIQGKIGCSIDRSDPNYCPIITVGASYPGFLSAMMRFVHPEVVDMAYASSAPLKLYDQSVDQYVYFDHITMVAERDSPGCAKAQKDTMYIIKDALEKMDMKKAAKKLGICHNKIPKYITSKEQFAETIVMMVSMSWADFNMDYHPPKDPSTAYVSVITIFMLFNLCATLDSYRAHSPIEIPFVLQCHASL